MKSARHYRIGFMLGGASMFAARCGDNAVAPGAAATVSALP